MKGSARQQGFAHFQILKLSHLQIAFVHFQIFKLTHFQIVSLILKLAIKQKSSATHRRALLNNTAK
jgi:hypothetical protein